MSKGLCIKCGNDAVTNCDNCNKPTCRDCLQLVVMKATDDEVHVFHRGKCVPKRFRRDEDEK